MSQVIPFGQVLARAERWAAPEPAMPAAQRQLAFVPSKPAQAGLEPRHSVPLGDRRMYPSDEGFQ